jgi:acetolactate synthase-1/2/3 large subunit
MAKSLRGLFAHQISKTEYHFFGNGQGCDTVLAENEYKYRINRKGTNPHMTVSEYIIAELARHGVNHIFGYIGAKNMALIEAAYKHPQMAYVNTLHEHSAAFAACGYAQASGKVGVATSTSGPGGTNMLTGIANAFCDSIPTLFITGQCGVKTLRNGLKIRNAATQEVDIVAMAQPVAKYAVQLHSASQIRHELEKCLHIAAEGRPGPVLLDLPEDLAFAGINPDELQGYASATRKYALPAEQIETLKSWIAASERPVLIVGNGAHGSEPEISKIAKATNIPIVSSAEAADVCDNTLPNYLGVAGNNGLRCANFTLANSDLIISVGCSFWSRYTGADKRRFAPEAKVARVDVDMEELNARNVKEDELKINCPAKQFFGEREDALLKISPSDMWLGKVAEYKKRYFCENKADANSPYAYMYQLSELLGDKDIVISDVGQHQLWALQSIGFHGGQRMLNSGGLSTMGYAIPAAIGAHYASPASNIVVLIGDGGLQMTSSELETYKRAKLPITVVVMNNRVLGVIRQLQDTYYGGKHYASELDYSVPDFAKVASAYGIAAANVISVEEFAACYKAAGGPRLINVQVGADADVRPRIIQRRPIEDLFPFLTDEELAENMIVPYERKPLK